MATPEKQPAPAGKPQVNDKGRALIQHFESCLEPTGDGRYRAYADPGYGWKIPTIGWGTIKYPDGRTVKQGDIITREQADEYFAWEVAEKADRLRSLISVPVNDDQFSALVSFAYNVGVGAFQGSTLRKRLNEGRYAMAADEFLKWNKSGGKVLSGLTRRRMSERRLFLSIDPAIVQHLPT
jgi:lysozyme